jgi:hypothetical protein
MLYATPLLAVAAALVFYFAAAQNTPSGPAAAILKPEPCYAFLHIWGHGNRS